MLKNYYISIVKKKFVTSADNSCNVESLGFISETEMKVK